MNLKTSLAVLFTGGALLFSARADITNGLVLQLNLDEGSGTTATDSSGLGNNGTLTANTTADWQWTSGWVAGALQMSVSRSSNYIRIPDAPSLNFVTTPAFTLAAWVKVPTQPNHPNRRRGADRQRHRGRR